MGKQISITVEKLYGIQQMISPLPDEIICLYVKDGDGRCELNNATLPLKGCGLYVFDKPYRYTGDSETEFVVLRFNRRTLEEVQRQVFFAHKSGVDPLLGAPCLNSEIVLSKLEYSLLENVFDGIRIAAQLGQEKIQALHLLTLLQVLEKYLPPVDADLTKQQILRYIHCNIQLPEALKIKQIATVFGISEQYFSAFFKRSYGCSYKDYIDGYRFEIIEHRLLEKGDALKDLVVEFGFTDASHLSKYFKKMKGVTLKEVIKE